MQCPIYHRHRSKKQPTRKFLASSIRMSDLSLTSTSAMLVGMQEYFPHRSLRYHEKLAGYWAQENFSRKSTNHYGARTDVARNCQNINNFHASIFLTRCAILNGVRASETSKRSALDFGFSGSAHCARTQLALWKVNECVPDWYCRPGETIIGTAARCLGSISRKASLDA